MTRKSLDFEDRESQYALSWLKGTSYIRNGNR